MDAPLDPETRELANAAAAPYGRYLRSADQADFDEAFALISAAIARARARGIRTLPGFLFNLSHLQYARYARTRDREALAEAYSLLVESVVLAPDEAEYSDRLRAIAQEQLRTLDPTSRTDARWYAELHRRLRKRVPGDHLMVWANLAFALRRLLDIEEDSDVGLLREFGEASERAAMLAPPGSKAAALSWDHAAEVLPFLAGLEHDAGRARRAARACEMAMRERPDEEADRRRTAALILARVLAYETEGREDDRVEAFRLLRSPRPGGTSTDRFPLENVQDVVASLLRRFHATGDVAARDEATETAVRCVRLMEPRNDVRYSQLPAMLNALGACLVARPDAASRPVPWPGWRPDPPGVPEPAVRHIHGAATALARNRPFVTDVLVAGSTGKTYTDETFSLVAAEWDEHFKGHAVTHVENALILPPQTGQGAEPVFIPANVHIVAVTLTAPKGTVTGVRAVVEAREPHHRADLDSVFCSGEVPRPDVNLLLDFDPPLVWPVFEPAAIPGTLVVRAVTENGDVRWRLELDWRSGQRSGTLVVPLRTTGETGSRTYTQDGEVLHAPGHVIGLADPGR
jgi:hypothetical protein